MAAVVSFTPPQSFLSHRWREFTPTEPRLPLIRPLPSSLNSTSCFSTFLPKQYYPTVAEESGPPPPPSTEAQSTVATLEVPRFGVCKTCGQLEIEKGCNGEGRIQGGIATIPGFGWWPIKAFRPCPGFVASGGRYRRSGQSMDEIAFGRAERDASVERTIKIKPSKRRQEPEGLEG